MAENQSMLSIYQKMLIIPTILALQEAQLSIFVHFKI